MATGATTSAKFTRRDLLYIVLFLAPVLAALLMIQVNAALVPRESVAKFVSVYLVVPAPKLDPKSGELASTEAEPESVPAPVRVSPAAVAQIYHYGIAASATFVLAVALVYQCFFWQKEISNFTAGRVNRWCYGILPAAVFILLIVAYVNPHIVDDEAVIGLFSLVNLSGVNPPFLFGADSRILGVTIFAAFLFSAATTALAAAGSPGNEEAKQEIDRRMQIVRSALLATSVVLVSALAPPSSGSIQAH